MIRNAIYFMTMASVLQATFVPIDFSLATENRPNTAQAQSAFNRVSPAVYQVKSAINREASKASYGTAWAVRADGVLVTNYHVISDAVQEEKKYKIFVLFDQEAVPAEILRVDIINDLALIKVDRTLPHLLQLAANPPQQGAKIFSIGFPEDLNLSITEGNYNEILTQGPYQIVHMATPLNGGMSGGPTVDREGKVVGVNVSVLLFAQNISFAVPLEKVRNLITRIPTKAEDLHPAIEKQLNTVQEDLMTDLGKEEINLPFPDWEVRQASSALKCWANNQDDIEDLYQGISHACQLSHAAYIRSEIHGGSYRLNYRTFHSEKLNLWQMYRLLNNNYNLGESSDFLFTGGGPQQDKKIYSKYDCGSEIVVNQYQIPFKINYCIRGMVRYGSLYNANIKAVSLLKNGKFIMFDAGLWAFSAENIQTFIRKHVDSIRLREKPI